MIAFQMTSAWLVFLGLMALIVVTMFLYQRSGTSAGRGVYKIEWSDPDQPDSKRRRRAARVQPDEVTLPPQVPPWNPPTGRPPFDQGPPTR